MAKRRVKIGIVQMSMSENTRGNLRKALDGVGEAASRGADIVCLPELFVNRYFPVERRSSATPERVPGPTTDALSACAKKNKVVLVGGSVFEKSGRRRFNTCLVFDEGGNTLTKYRKVHLPQDEHYYEQDYFSSGSAYQVARTKFGGVGSLICFDQWYPEAARVEKLMGADLLFYPTAIGWVRGIEQEEGDWRNAWESVQVGHAIANSVIVCAVNRVGVEGGTEFWGSSFVCDQFGKVLFRADGKEGVHVVSCDISLGAQVEKGWGFMRNRMGSSYGPVVER